MAMSPSDENNKDILHWLDLLQTSLKSGTSNAERPAMSAPASASNFGGHRGGEASFGDEESDTESPGEMMGNRKVARQYGLQEGDENAMYTGGSGSGSMSSPFEGSDGELEEDEDVRLTHVPDEVVPLGLIANLALDDAKTDKTLTGKRSHGGMGAQGRSASDAAADAGRVSGSGGGAGGSGTKVEEDVDEDNVGVANKTYFFPGKKGSVKLALGTY